MDPDYWNRRWQEGRTGWHQEAPTPLLVEHWPALEVAPGSRVLVPLAGRSHDMHWLAAQGLQVLGVELSTLAVEGFFADAGLRPEREPADDGVLYRAGGIGILCGDVFDLRPDRLAQCAAVYDRAALIALPPAMRARYAERVYGGLPAGCHGLLVTLEYPQDEKEGPPFSVPGPEVAALLGGHWDIERLTRRDILAGQPSFQQEGVTRLHTSAYRMVRRRDDGASRRFP